ncbi:hypothetical protein CFC21_043100 [Triticum aestivum]|uniref:BTB domain-containing protein n=3 Tax=Triticum TaxID=4564 RepID=A0A9R1FNP0_WHEAT|nr:hypothetical protein CFC21_043100 [Triticum aestivum]CDM85210.1 unnamed protein product [Triticum aestivum]VAH82406.1 unnamed protein product [Triticum turgidum subsp. durum]
MSFAGVSITRYAGDTATGHAVDVSTASGYHLFVVTDYYLRTKASVPPGKAIASLPFTVGGRRWSIRCFPNGDTSESSQYISLYLHLVDKDVTEAVKVHYSFSFVDEVENQGPACVRAKKAHDFSSCHATWGHKYFWKRDDLEKSSHLKGNCFTIRCDLAVATTFDRFITVPPSSIQRHIMNLLLSKEGTDVTFSVGGETIVAHRCVLAARSSVFKAELFGPMMEGTVASVIQIEDMEARVFRALLSFIYTDSLPDIEVDNVEEREAQELLWLQHLLAAADRYDLQRLKVLCEEKLCKHIAVSSVRTIFILAERHSCGGLKEVCLEFLKTPSNLKEITAAEVFDDIISTCPYLLKELIAKFAS